MRPITDDSRAKQLAATLTPRHCVRSPSHVVFVVDSPGQTPPYLCAVSIVPYNMEIRTAEGLAWSQIGTRQPHRLQECPRCFARIPPNVASHHPADTSTSAAIAELQYINGIRMSG